MNTHLNISNQSMLSNNILQECIDEALLDGPRLIQQWIQTVNAQLIELQQLSASTKEQKHWRQTFEALQVTRIAIQGLWVRHWHQSMSDALQQKPANVHFQLNSLRFDSLELMSQEQIDATVEAARFEQTILLRIRSIFKQWLNRLNHMLGSAEQTTLSTNPLRPETAIQSLVYTLTTTCTDHKIQSSLLQIGCQSFTEQLEQLYSLLDRILDHHQGPLLSANFEALLPSAEKDIDTKAKTAKTTNITLSELHQLLINDWSNSSTDHSKRDHEPEWKETTLVDTSLLITERRRRPRNGQVGQANRGPLRLTDLAEEVVGLMLDSITKDTRLLPPLVEMLQELRPALLQAAREEPRFFADRENPARRLLDELTQRSLAYADSDAPEFQIYLKQIKDTLAALHTAGTTGISAFARFTRALEILTVYLNQSKSKSDGNDSSAVADLLIAEQQYLLTDKVKQEFAARSDIKSASPELLSLIYNIWAQVIANERLSISAHSDSLSVEREKRYLMSVSDLIWSCNPALSAQNTSRLIKIIPNLLRNLREGLQRISLPPEEAHQFIRHVIEQHAKALKTIPSSAPYPEEKTASADTLAFDRSSHKSDWLTTIPFGLSDFAQTEPLGISPSIEALEQPIGIWPELVCGAWVEIDHPEGQHRRARLNWISPRGIMYLFKDTYGEQFTLSKPMCSMLFQQQRLRVIAAHSLVEDALDSVMEKAILNSAIGI